MNNIRFGLKLWSTNTGVAGDVSKLIADGLFQYIELMVVPDTDISVFRKMDVPFIIHATSENWDVNIARKDREGLNFDAIGDCLAWADALRAEYLILHPGFGELDVAVDFLSKLSDRRILIENMPKLGMDGEKMIGYAPLEIKKLVANKFGFCLDLNHAAKAAASVKKNYKQYIADFLKLNPKVFHISDGNFESESDDHLNIGKGNYDFKFFADCAKKSETAYISLETPRINLDSLSEDVDNLNKLRHFFF